MKTNAAFYLCRVFLPLAATVALSGCIPALVGVGATTSGVVVAQERSAGNAVDDAGIKLTIDNLYINKDINDLFKNVHVSVCEGRVMLTGAVQKEETKESAAQLAWKANGVREVINDLQVGGGGIMDYARDSWIDTQIRSRLLIEKNVRSENYNNETVNGTVYFLGIAQNQEELNKVTYLAATTKYVKQVVSHVIMKDDPRRRPYGTNNPPARPGQTQMPGGPPPQGGYSSGGQPETDGSSGGQPETGGGYSGNGQPESSHVQQQSQ